MSKDNKKESDFSRIVEQAISRRSLFRASATLGTAAFLARSSNSSAHASADHGANNFSFESVPANTKDTVSVPRNFQWHVVVRWGDPLWSDGPEFNSSSRGTAASQNLAFGDNNDGIELFSKGDRTILAVNNESLNLSIMYGNRDSGLPKTTDDIQKGKAAVGLSILEISENNGRWSMVQDSEYNRRITANTKMEMTGPARGHALLKTDADPEGKTPIGTWSNCGSGRTPWGTYLTCEEHFNRYFASKSPSYQLTESMKRYGIQTNDRGYNWGKYDERFDISKHPNEPNRFGYVVEVDALDPDSTPKKRSALGRFKHENAAVTVNKTGHVVVYMGDDEGGEFLYRFISEKKFSQSGDNSTLLENGALYVAQFHDNMTGEWIKLSPETTGMRSQAEI